MIVLTEEHGWLTELLMKSSQEIVDAIMEQVFGLINRFFTDISWIVSSSQIESLITVVITLSASFLSLLAVKQLLMTHALEMDGDPDSEPLQIVKKICIAVALITSHPFIFNSIMDISDMVYDLAIENIDAEVTAPGAWGN
ncbi:MAG: conjugal transfer protein TrbL family protein, partial [Paludibacteraceae bacterium]